MAENTESFPKLGSVYRISGWKINGRFQNSARTKLNSEQSGDSKIDSLRSQDLSGGSGSRAWCPQNTSSNAWGKPNLIRKLAVWGNGESGEANGKSQEDKSNIPNNLSCSGKGSNLSVRGDDTTPSMDEKRKQCNDERIPEPHDNAEYENDDEELVDDDDYDIVFDSDDDLSLDDEDESHEARKRNEWFGAFFDKLDGLTIEEINSQERQWHCPACRGISGHIAWYKGMQPLVNHARTLKARRAKLHRQFAETLEEELLRRNASITLAGEVYGRWEGLGKQFKDHEIVWPPVVVIMNTRYEQDEHNKVTCKSYLYFAKLKVVSFLSLFLFISYHICSYLVRLFTVFSFIGCILMLIHLV